MLPSKVLRYCIAFISLLRYAKGVFYGENCSKYEDCDFSKHQGCIDGVCQCTLPYEMVLDHSSGKCFTLPSGPCGDLVFFKNANFNSLSLPCVNNAICDNGVCVCSKGQFATYNRTCKPQKLYGEPCNSNSMCRDDFCDAAKNNTCTCKPSQIFLAHSGGCKTKRGERPNVRHSTENVCVPNSFFERNSKTCECGFTAEYSKKLNDGFCYIKNGEKCNGQSFENSDKVCFPGLLCQNRKCSCKYKEHQTISYLEEKCLSFVGGPCNVTSDCEHKNAECADENGISQCKCKTGFVEYDRGCDIAYGETCDQTENGEKCDRFVPLECRAENICGCPELQVYDANAQQCRGQVGAKCTVTLETRENLQGFCVDGATCQPFRGRKDSSGICQCVGEWKTENNRTCTII